MRCGIRQDRLQKEAGRKGSRQDPEEEADRGCGRCREVHRAHWGTGWGSLMLLPVVSGQLAWISPQEILKTNSCQLKNMNQLPVTNFGPSIPPIKSILRVRHSRKENSGLAVKGS